MRLRSIVIALSLAAWGAAAPALAADPPQCTIAKAAELPVTMRGTRPMVPVKINGQDTFFLADSGAFFSSLSPEAAQRLGLKMKPAPFGLRLKGVGGQVSVKVGVADQMILDGIPLKNIEFLVAEGVAMGADDNVGLLGQNVLGFADVEYDLANGVIRLMIPKGCERAAPVYWRKAGQDVGVLEVEPMNPGSPHLKGRAVVNGQPIKVMLDTGASTSVLKLSTARRLGFRIENEGVTAGGVGGGIGRRRMESWVAPFDSFEIGGEAIRNTRFRVADIELDDADMLLGADFFLAHRLYVARKQHRVYFTYNGGPVFRLEREAGPRPRIEAQAAPGAAAPPPTPGEALPDADAYARRAAAFAARRDYEHAAADLSRAIEMEPKQARHYVERAMIRLASRQPVLAMGDFDEALKLKPDDERALLGRGELYLRRQAFARAEADFEAAAKAAGPSSDVRLNIGASLTAAGRYEPALAHYDTWIAEHPNDERLASALNSRCWTRAQSGRQLDLALADCEAAIKRGGRQAAPLDSRGLVKLRLGRFDEAIADYDAALKLQPKNAWSLYGRGVARLRKGQTAQGKADIDAALALQPGLRERARRAGITEEAQPASGA